MPSPSHTYYRACQGRWRSPLDFRVTDPAACRACGMGLVDRLRLLSIVYWPRFLGPLTLDTTVAKIVDDCVVHTTMVTWAGVVLMSSREVIELDADGRGFVLRGERRMGPNFWTVESFGGPGAVDAGATSARYTFLWFGAEMVQTTEASPDLVIITQRSAWAEGIQRLVRRDVGATSGPRTPSTER